MAGMYFDDCKAISKCCHYPVTVQAEVTVTSEASAFRYDGCPPGLVPHAILTIFRPKDVVYTCSKCGGGIKYDPEAASKFD